MSNFVKECIKKITGSKRVGIKNVMTHFNSWCKKNNIKECKKLKDFKHQFENTTGLKRTKVNINGYKIELKI